MVDPTQHAGKEPFGQMAFCQEQPLPDLLQNCSNKDSLKAGR
jgi:hypothetical protein